MEVVEKDAASIAAAIAASIAAALRNLAAKNKNVFAQQRLNSVPSSKSAPLPPSSQSGSLAPLLGKWGKPGNCWHGLAQWTVASNSKW